MFDLNPTDDELKMHKRVQDKMKQQQQKFLRSTSVAPCAEAAHADLNGQMFTQKANLDSLVPINESETSTRPGDQSRRVDT